MDILDAISVSLRCPRCGALYEVPLKNIRAAQEQLHLGCPVEMTEDCPQLFWGSLADEGDLQALRDAWNRLDARVRSQSGQLVIHGDPQSAHDEAAHAPH